MAVVPYTVQEPLSHDGKQYAVGEVVPLSANDAAPLIAAGVVVVAEAPKKGKAKE